MPEAQLDDLALIRLQLVENGLDLPVQFGLLRVDHLGRLVSLLRWMPGRNRCVVRHVSLLTGGTGPAQAFVAGHRIQPRAQLRGLGQVAERGGDDKGLPHGFGSVRWLGQHPMAVAVETSRVPVIRHGDARRVPGRGPGGHRRGV